MYLLDLHSFLGLIEDEICLGNGNSTNSTTCSEHLISVIESAFCSESYQVVRNKVFSGGYITRTTAECHRLKHYKLKSATRLT
ncbi:N-formylglutamate amidohydrolase [Leptolyngbya sp. Cla-17]|uniref:N-formylglutamate amidohydrolase n=1 Tax=Leptolyngbya sp. Cla-17 TaxID=2803751 RepID=UPI001FD93FF1